MYQTINRFFNIVSVGWSKEGLGDSAGVLAGFGVFFPGRGAASRERRRPQCSAAATGPAPAADRADGPGGRPAAAPADRPRGRPAVPARPLRLRSVLRRPSAPPDAPHFIFRKSGVESRATHSRQSSVHCVEIQSSCEKYCTWSQPKHVQPVPSPSFVTCPLICDAVFSSHL